MKWFAFSAVAALSLAVAAGCGPGSQTEETHGTTDAPSNPAPSGGGSPTSASTSGADLYRQHCSGCHGEDGERKKGVSLAHEATEPDTELREVIRNGEGQMPAFKDKLSDEQISAVIAHLKTFAATGGGKAAEGH